MAQLPDEPAGMERDGKGNAIPIKRRLSEDRRRGEAGEESQTMNSTAFRYLAIASALLCSACASQTADDMRSAPSHTRTFETPADFETVFEREKAGMLRCMTGMYYTFTFGIEPHSDKANKTASISYVQRGGIPAKIFWGLIDIHGTDRGSTVTVDTNWNVLMKDLPDIAETWANGGTQCPSYAPALTRQFPVVSG